MRQRDPMDIRSFVNTASGGTNSARTGGLGAEYTSIAVDGVSAPVASLPGGVFKNVAHSTSFELISLNSMESLEISRAITADVGANATAGTIFLCSKSAFHRCVTHFATRLVLKAHSIALTFDKTLGPDDDRGSLIIRSGFITEFSTAVRNELGLIVNLSESNIYSVTHRTTLNRDYNPTAPPRTRNCHPPLFSSKCRV